jgi:hypothetical protein
MKLEKIAPIAKKYDLIIYRPKGNCPKGNPSAKYKWNGECWVNLLNNWKSTEHGLVEEGWQFYPEPMSWEKASKIAKETGLKLKIEHLKLASDFLRWDNERSAWYDCWFWHDDHIMATLKCDWVIYNESTEEKFKQAETKHPILVDDIKLMLKDIKWRRESENKLVVKSLKNEYTVVSGFDYQCKLIFSLRTPNGIYSCATVESAEQHIRDYESKKMLEQLREFNVEVKL